MEREYLPNDDTGLLPEWYRSTYCELGTCVGVAMFAEGMVGMRDGKNPKGSYLVFNRDAWRGFLVLIGDLDPPK